MNEVSLNANLTLHSRVINRDTKTGYRTIDVWHGTYDACIGTISQYDATKYNCRVDPFQPPVYQLTVDRPFLDDGGSSVEPPASIWELHGNAITKDIMEHPNSLNMGRAMLRTVQAGANDVKSATSADVDAADTFAQDAIAVEADGDTDLETAALMLYDLLIKGVTSYQQSQYVLRRTQIVGSNSGESLTLTFQGVEKVYTTGQVDYEAQIPSTLIFSIGNINPITVPTDDSYLAGWLKQTPTVRQVSNNKYEVHTEWWLEGWSAFLYELFVGPTTIP